MAKQPEDFYVWAVVAGQTTNDDRKEEKKQKKQLYLYKHSKRITHTLNITTKQAFKKT